MTSALTPAPIANATFFDGRLSRAHRVRARWVGERLELDGEGMTWAPPKVAVRWQGPSLLIVGDGAELHLDPGHGLATSPLSEGPAGPGRLPNRALALAALGLTGLALTFAAIMGPGLSLLERAVAATLPSSVDQTIGERQWRRDQAAGRQASKLPASLQAKLTAAMAAATDRARVDLDIPPYELAFTFGDKSGKPGPNLAMGHGLIYLVDGTIQTARKLEAKGEAPAEAIIAGVFGHELGHLAARHNARALVHAILVRGALTLATGDYYLRLNRELEHLQPVRDLIKANRRAHEVEAYQYARAFLLAAGYPTGAMVSYYELMLPHRERFDSARTHPTVQDRIDLFREAFTLP